MPYRNPNQIWSTIQLQGVPNKKPYPAMCWLSRYKWRWSALTISAFNKSATMNGAAYSSRFIQSMSITACLPPTRLTDSLMSSTPGKFTRAKINSAVTSFIRRGTGSDGMREDKDAPTVIKEHGGEG